MENLIIHQFYTELTLELDSKIKPSSIEFRKVGNQLYKLNLVNTSKTTDNNTIIYLYNNSID